MTTDTTPAAIEALLKDVTPGLCVAVNNPGDWGLGGNWTVSVAPHDYDAIIAEIPYQTPYCLGEKQSVRDRASAAHANAHFIAWCFNNVPAIAAELTAARQERDAGAKDYCALMERHDAEFVRAEKAETEAAALRKEVEQLREALSDPIAVHANMLRGAMALPSVENIIHIYGAEALRAALARMKEAT